jgi:SPP1 gp7 family putative phage head morphogenesis protein
MVQRRFAGDIKSRFKKLKVAVRGFLDTEDELGLKDRGSFVTAAREFQFRTDAGKLQAFSDWFAQQVQAKVFSVPPGTPPGTPWTAKYVESAYKTGLTNSFFAARRDAVEGALTQSQEQFLRSSFNQPEALSKIQLLATRAFEELKGISANMSSEMSRILAQGMVDGTGAEDIAREMSERIDSLTRSRALLVARTEIINAHAEGQLDAFQELGIEELGVMAEWSTAGDDRVCPICAEFEGKVFTVEEARGMIPAHPNCRCAWIPFVGEPKPR